jgi:myo-inositol catabolism protein IolS
MLQRVFGHSGISTSVVGLGTWNIGNQWGFIDEATSYATIRSAFDSGMTLFDTAESYGIPNGLSEERLGRALAGIRHQVTVVSKTGNWGKRTGGSVELGHADVIRLCVHASLHRLQTEWIDVMLCHDGNIEDPSVYIEGFEALIAEGRIRFYGVSTNNLDVVKRFNQQGTCSVVQVDYSLMNRQPEEEFLGYCSDNDIGVMVRGPLAQGLLSGRYDKTTRFTDPIRENWHANAEAQARLEANIDRVEQFKAVAPAGSSMVEVALQYVISHRSVSVVIPGARSTEQSRTNAEAGAAVLSDDLIAKLQAASLS